MPIGLPDKIKPVNGRDFPIAEAEDIELSDGTRLDAQPIIKTVEELPSDAAEHPNVLYLVVENETNGNSGEPSE